MEIYQDINEVLVVLFNKIMGIEEKAIITDEFQDISVNDMHIIEAIGLGTGNNMSAIAKKLDITVGSLTTSMNSIVNKGYAVRRRSMKDRRMVYIELTEKGRSAYMHHAAFHDDMTRAVTARLREDELPVLFKTIKGLNEYFERYEKDRTDSGN